MPNAVHNKLKEKRAEIPQDVSYFSGADIPDVWVDCEPALSFARIFKVVIDSLLSLARRPVGAGRVCPVLVSPRKMAS